MKRAIVTGATGMIASALIRNLISNNIEVYALCRPGEEKNDEFFKSPLVTAIDADISELKETADKITEKCDVLYHFAGHFRRRQKRRIHAVGQHQIHA